jgi:hypothetical protein
MNYLKNPKKHLIRVFAEYEYQENLIKYFSNKKEESIESMLT